MSSATKSNTLVRAGATTQNAYPVTIDYGQSLANMIAAG